MPPNTQSILWYIL